MNKKVEEVKVSYKKGDDIWIVSHIGLKKYTVASCGSKYLTVEGLRGVKFDSQTLKQINIYGFSYRIITDVEEYKKRQERYCILEEIKQVNWEDYGTDVLIDVLNQINNMKE